MGEDLLVAEQIALLFFGNVVQFFGIPTSIIHDRNLKSTSGCWQSMWKVLRSRAITISAHYPQVNA